MVNSAIEVAPHDPEVAARTAAFLGKLQAAFVAALRVAERRGELTVGDVGDVGDVDCMAWRLANAGFGMATLSKTGVGQDVLLLISQDILSSLRPSDSPSPPDRPVPPQGQTP